MLLEFEDLLRKYKEEKSEEEIQSYVTRSFVGTDTSEKITSDMILKENKSSFIWGEAGLGKTYLADKLVHDWASDDSTRNIMLRIDCQKLDTQIALAPKAAPFQISESGKSHLHNFTDEQLESLHQSFYEHKLEANRIIFLVDGIERFLQVTV